MPMLKCMNVLTNKLATFIIIFVFSGLCYADDKLSETVLLFARNNSIWVYEFESKKQYEIIKNADNPACSPDGRQVAFTRGSNIWMVDLPTGKQNQITKFIPVKDNIVQNLTWYPSGPYILFERSEQYEIRSMNGKNPVVWPDGEFEPRSRRILLSSIWLMRIGKTAKKFIGYTGGHGGGTVGTDLSQVEFPSWSPDGEEIAFSRNGDIWMAGVESLEEPFEYYQKGELRLLPIATLIVSYGGSVGSKGARKISWFPDGKKLVFTVSRMYGSGVGELWTVDSNGKNAKLILPGIFEAEWPIALDEEAILYNYGSIINIINIDGTNERELIRDAEKACLCKRMQKNLIKKKNK